MPRNGSGTFAAAASSVNPAVASTTIDPVAFNALIADIEDALTFSISKDGQTVPTANLAMGGFRHTNAGEATARTHYLQAGQHQDGGAVYAAGSGTNDITATLSPAPAAYAAGMAVDIKPANDNTGAVTLDLNSIGAKDVTKDQGSALVAGDLQAGGIYRVVYDGTQFRLQGSNTPSINNLTEETTPADNDSVAVYDQSAGKVVKQTTRDMMMTLVPPGVVLPFAGGSTPQGWLQCYGQAISRTTYADLFDAIGTTYGVGDGSTTFNVPDLRGRAVAGKDNMGGTSANRLTDQSGGLNGDTLGDTGGSETHQLTEAELAAHTHTYDLPDDDSSNVQLGGSGARKQHSATSTASGSTGGDTAHNNVQPTIILNYIIRT